MQFTMNVQDLLDGLNTVTRALSPRPPKQILEGVLVSATEDGVNLTCSDGSLSIDCTLTADVQQIGRVVLPGRLFTELCRKLPGGRVTIRVGDGHQASIRCAQSRSNLAGMSAIEYPEMNEITGGVTVAIPQNRLREMISHVVFAIATDESRQILTGCLLELEREEGRLIALDGFRLAMQKVSQRFDLSEGTEQLRAVIPGRVLSEMSKILADEETPCELLLAKGHMMATFGNTRLYSVLLAGEYIDYRRIVPSSFKATATVDRIAVQNAIDRASLMAREGKNNLIRMSFREDGLTITSNAEMGDVHEEMPAQLSGDPLDIAFNAKYITDVIRNISDARLCMCFNSNVSPCVVRPTEGDTYLYLVLPVRVFQ